LFLLWDTDYGFSFLSSREEFKQQNCLRQWRVDHSWL